jgi:hypothetical protein
MSHRENVVRIKTVYGALEELGREVVFVGGATVSLYADRPAAETRPTEDVDILVEILHYRDYAAIEERLRSKGFVNDAASGVICRYQVRGIVVDVMPTGENALGFTNPWYQAGFATSMEYILEEGYTIRIFHPIYFLASKLEAFKDRGGGDGRWSSDFEDIVFVLNHRTTIWQEVRAAEGSVRDFLRKEMEELLQNKYIDEWISVHLEQGEQKRLRTILGELESFVKE